jgi:hypothetical protein
MAVFGGDNLRQALPEQAAQRTLNIIVRVLTLEDVLHISKATPCWRSLSLIDCRFASFQAWEAFIVMVFQQQHLNHVNFSYSKWYEPIVFRDVWSVLPRLHVPTLTHLHLNDCGLPTTAASLLANLLDQMTLLVSLELDHNPNLSFQLPLLMAAVGRHRRLNRLSLNYIDFGFYIQPYDFTTNILALGAMLQTTTSLGYLSLEGNHFTPWVGTVLTTHLHHNTTLQTLSVLYNPALLGMSFTEALLTVARRPNSLLSEVEHWSGEESEPDPWRHAALAHDLAQALQQNRRRYLRLTWTPTLHSLFPPEVRDTIMKMVVLRHSADHVRTLFSAELFWTIVRSLTPMDVQHPRMDDELLLMDPPQLQCSCYSCRRRRHYRDGEGG